MRLTDLDGYVNEVRKQLHEAYLREEVETLLRNEPGLRDLPDDQQDEILRTLLGKALRKDKAFRKDFIRRERRFQRRFRK